MNTVKEITERCDRLTETLGTMIGWLQLELGQDSCHALLDKLHGTTPTEAAQPPTATIPIDDLKPLIAALFKIESTDDWQNVAKALTATKRFLDLHPELHP